MDGDFGVQLIGAALALLFVLLLAWASLRWLSRLRATGARGDDGLRVERMLAIGARERLVVVRYADQELLLGVTPGAVSLLQQRPVTPGRDNPPP